MSIESVARSGAKAAVSVVVATLILGSWGVRGAEPDSPLSRINAENVGKLALAWYADYGVLYIPTAWNKVKAYDARTGQQLWAFQS